jgi:hypothetical protein
MYGFEPLKYELNGFYSFNLAKNSGLIRLIIKPDDSNNSIYLVFISYKHYEDFTKERVIYYDE